MLCPSSLLGILTLTGVGGGVNRDGEGTSEGGGLIREKGLNQGLIEKKGEGEGEGEGEGA